MREINLKELSIKQKISFVMTALIEQSYTEEETKENIEYILEKIKERAIGAVWVNPDRFPDFKEIIATIKEIADYPILIVTDAESGLTPYKVGKHNAIGMTDSEDLAYTFGKLTAATAREWGYNLVCNPILDMANSRGVCGSTIRSFGNNKERVAALAAAEIKGMHDGGVLTLAKHYPGGKKDSGLDSHMSESFCYDTKEDLLDYALYPYLQLDKQGLLDGIMVTHTCYKNIDPDHPASLSKPVIDIIRDQGFDGIVMTDGLSMMGVVAKYGKFPPYSMSVAAGNDLPLPWNLRLKDVHEAAEKAFEAGVFTEEMLDKAIGRIIAAQKKAYEFSQNAQPINENDKKNYARIATDAIFARTKDGVLPSLDKDGNYCFFVLSDAALTHNDDGYVSIDTLSGGWYNPNHIIDHLTKAFPNSIARAIGEYPLPWQISQALYYSLEREVVFITYSDSRPYIGDEILSSRILSMMKSFYASDRLSTVVHFGNPYMMEDIPPVDRIIIGSVSDESIEAAFEVLEGKRQPKGVLTYNNISFK